MNTKIIKNGSCYYEVYSDGRIFSKQKNKFLPQHSNGKGYLGVNMWDGKKSKREYVHRLVAICFLDNSRNLTDVNHIDGNKENNNYLNLEWTSRYENMKHARDNGFFKKYKKHMEENHKSWIGERVNNRVILSVLDENSNGNYKVVVRCDCSNILTMYYNDFKKAKHKKCRKCTKD